MKTIPALITLLLVSTPLAQEPRPHPSPHPPGDAEQETEAFAEARDRLQKQDFQGAERGFRAILERNPDHGSAWFFLGYTVHMQKRWEEALELHVRASQHEKYRPAALYNAGCACALLGRKEAAFEWLAKAFAAGFDNRRLVCRDPDLDSLRDDPRLQEYLPQVSEDDSPFLGDVRVLHVFEGESPGDQFGWEGRNAGDCDADGKNDVLISAPYQSADGANSGRVYVYSGATGELLFTRSGKQGEYLGIGVEAAGDVNADGHADVIAGATGCGKLAGRAYVYSGAGGRLLLRLTAKERGDSFGWKVAGVGDMNDDGHADVAVGAPGSDATGQDAGRVYVFSGHDGSQLFTIDGESEGDALGGSLAGISDGEHKLIAVGAGDAGPGQRGRVSVFEVDRLSVRPRFTIDADESGENLGHMFVSFVGDVDADGFPDVYSSDWQNHARGRRTGRAYVHSGRTGAALLTLTGEHAGDGFGIGTALAGDVNGDGHDDLIIGAWRSGQGAPDAGKCYVYSGRDGGLIEQYVCSSAGDAFGFDAVGLGDLDGDGGTDFLVTSAWSSARGKKSGRAYVIAGPPPSSDGPVAARVGGGK